MGRHNNDGGQYLALMAQNMQNIAKERDRATSSLFGGFASFGEALEKIDERSRVKENDEFQKQRALEQQKMQQEAFKLQRESFDFQKEQEKNRLKQQEWQNNFALKQFNARNELNPLQREQYRSMKLDNDILQRGYEEYMGLQSSNSPISSYISQQENVSDTTEANTTTQREPLARNEHIAQSTQRDTQNAMEKMWSNTPKIKNKNLKTNSGYEGEAGKNNMLSVLQNTQGNTQAQFQHDRPYSSFAMERFKEKYKLNDEIKLKQTHENITTMNRTLVNAETAFIGILSLMPALNKNSGLISGAKRFVANVTGDIIDLNAEEQRFKNLNNSIIRSIGKMEFGNDTGGNKIPNLEKDFQFKYGDKEANIGKLQSLIEHLRHVYSVNLSALQGGTPHQIATLNKFEMLDNYLKTTPLKEIDLEKVTQELIGHL